MIEAVILAYFVIIALAQLICDFTLGGLFMAAGYGIVLAVRVAPIIAGEWLMFRLVKG